MSKTVIALFEDTGRARGAIDALKARGFDSERIQLQSGEEFVKWGHVPPMEQERAGAWSSIKSFFDEVGLTSPKQPPSEGEYHPIQRDDGVILLETNDERADEAAEILDRAGAINVEERLKQKARPDDTPSVAMGLEPNTSGRTPPGMHQVEEHQDIDERTLAGTGRGTAARPRCTRIYDCPPSAPPGGTTRH